jgi:hypothetical protein
MQFLTNPEGGGTDGADSGRPAQAENATEAAAVLMETLGAAMIVTAP